MCQTAGTGINDDVVQMLTAELKDILGLRLFGFDVIVQEHSGAELQHHVMPHQACHLLFSMVMAVCHAQL